MINRNLLITVLIIFITLPLSAQEKKQDQNLNREVTLYNPYKPSIQQSRKISFFPDMSDTSKVRPVFRYDVTTEPFMPEYTISPIKAATLLPDPLPRLYKSYLNAGLGNYVTPFAEISISNERSKKGNIGFYARHYSTNGKIELPNLKKVFAGYMDNNASLYGRRFFRKAVLEGSVDYTGKTRYAYGYDPVYLTYDPSKKEIKRDYNNAEARISLSSLNLDSADFSYDFDIAYNYFFTKDNISQNGFGLNGLMAKTYNGFYIGSGLLFDIYSMPADISAESKYIAAISPFVKKRSDQWYFKLGMQVLFERNMTSQTVMHFYPDINLGFDIVPSYIRFFAGLSGKLENNTPMSVVDMNPFLYSNKKLLSVPNTDHQLIITAGLRGNTGFNGSYLISTSYSVIKDMLFFSNIVNDTLTVPSLGNRFAVITDDIDLLRVHGEINGQISDKMSFYGEANYYQYTMTSYEYPWNKAEWDGKLGLKYNLRNKIIAGLDITGQGMRHEIINGYILPVSQSLLDPPVPGSRLITDLPAHFNLNFSAEYRYSKILSFWTRLNNISTDRYFEWAYYPSQRFLFMFGFTYSL
ncbi:MAG TPA: hypothetical protein VJ963_07265 [Bacteroidales bacterium]|nr:hypothetical protein [Bacteroidales bacterium]